MKLLCICGIVMFLAVGVSPAEEPPDWARHDYAASADEVYRAALMVIVLQHGQLKGQKGSPTLEFHLNKPPGYDMKLTVTRIDDSHSRVVMGMACAADKNCKWSSVRKEVLRIIDRIDAELRKKTAGAGLALYR